MNKSILYKKNILSFCFLYFNLFKPIKFMKIIGITGQAAAWKGTVVDYLMDKKWFEHYSVSDYLAKLCKEEWKEPNRDNLREKAIELKQNHHPAYLMEIMMEEAVKNAKDAIIESLRSPVEVEALRKNKDFVLMAVKTNQNTRYERAIKRGSAKDNITFEHFQEQDRKEAKNDDPTQCSIYDVEALADVVIDNNRTLEDLYKQLDDFLENQN